MPQCLYFPLLTVHANPFPPSVLTKQNKTKSTKTSEQLKAAVHSIEFLFVVGLGKTVEWNELVSLAANYGTFVLLALPESPVAINLAELIFRQVNVTGSLTGERRTVLEMLDFADEHNTRPWIEKREMNDWRVGLASGCDGDGGCLEDLESDIAEKKNSK